jgi:hypothetical protein
MKYAIVKENILKVSRNRGSEDGITFLKDVIKLKMHKKIIFANQNTSHV